MTNDNKHDWEMAFEVYWETRENLLLKSGMSLRFIENERRLRTNWSDKLTFEHLWKVKEKEIQSLNDKMEKARGALEFYSSADNWEDRSVVYCYDCISEEDLTIPEGLCDKRGGARARQALKEIFGEEK